jgi:outer membrane receptor protein involved in Fe transport
VTLYSNGQQFNRWTQPDGSFLFEGLSVSSGTLVVAAQGFASDSSAWSGENPVSITLSPAPVLQSLDVTATRTAILPTGVDDVEAQPDAVVLPTSLLQQWGSLAIDDKLRQVPGFSLLRRSGSMTTNPTAQGVSLRGLGASGASRALVLADGIPLNDPFGGWIFWGRVPQAALDQVQIVPGGISALYGNDALGGVINLVTRPAVQTYLAAEGSFGSSNTPFGSATAAVRFGEWAVIASGEGFHTNGYIAVPPEVRGSVDTPVASEHWTGTLRLQRLFGSKGRVFLEGSIYGEHRLNGTPLQTNEAAIRQLAFGSDYNSPAAGLFTLRLYGGTENYHQTFSSIALNRNSESLTNDQNVPVSNMGMIGQWSKQVARRVTLLAGLDGSDVEGTSEETTYTRGAQTAMLWNGGRQQSLGAFLEGLFQISNRWSVTFSAREDLWSNFDASSKRVPTIGRPTITYFPPRGQNSFDPRLTTSFRATDHVVLYASGYRSFRAPTLNELYRSFRVGNVQTLANAYLRAEHFAGAEGGGRASFLEDRLSLRGSMFWGYVTDPVENVTLSVTPQLILRQRQNLGRTRAAGFETGADFRITNNITLSGSYQFVDSTVVSFPADPSLVGNMVPLVPRNEFTFQGTWAAPRKFFVAVQGRTASNEYDDDQNLLPLGGYFVLSATVSRPLPKGFTIFVAGENLTNQSYEIGRTPVVTLGQPILGRIGLRWQSPN